MNSVLFDIHILHFSTSSFFCPLPEVPHFWKREGEEVISKLNSVTLEPCYLIRMLHFSIVSFFRPLPPPQVLQFWFKGENSIENEFSDPENLGIDIHIAFVLILTLAPSRRDQNFGVKGKVMSNSTAANTSSRWYYEGYTQGWQVNYILHAPFTRKIIDEK